MIALLAEEKHEVLDVGTYNKKPVDYPDYTEAVGAALREYRAERGIMLCGSGVGASMVANRIPGIRAVLSNCGNCRQAWFMDTPTPNYRSYRFPPEIIGYAAWLYHRFCLSFRDVEELLAQRGVTVSYEAVRQWSLKFGQVFARQLRHRQGRPGDTWHLDELVVTMNGERHYLWRAVDQDGDVLDILIQKRRDQ